MSELILLQPDGGEQALEAIKLMAQEKAVDLIILDSIVACVPESELEGELADPNISQNASFNLSDIITKFAGATLVK